MKIVAIIQARTGATRLPGKIFLPLGGKPVIRWVIDRIKKCNEINDILLATTTNEGDDALEDLCVKSDIAFFRGSEDDVLGRYYFAAKSIGLDENDIVVRITGDCPLIDPKLCDDIVSSLINGDADYASNIVTCTFPDGLDCEAMKFSALEKSWREAELKYEREHVTQYILRHPEIFKVKNYFYPVDLSYMRWTLDEPRDYEFIKTVIDGIGKDDFDMKDVLDFIEKNPRLLEINSSITRNEGLIKSIQEENL